MGRLAAAIAADTLTPLDGNPLRFGLCVSQPGTVVCGGLNYRAHAAESGCVFR
jgi:2-keto-4-pentenoate hydratase/2-oxohepta-3-ene-1,7-dioic acid hydratase in catechol pathway